MLAPHSKQSATISQTRTDIGEPQSGHAQASTPPCSHNSRGGLPAIGVPPADFGND
jgi:hypothetical protein